jgi:hypothetical protein
LCNAIIKEGVIYPDEDYGEEDDEDEEGEGGKK